MRTAILGFAAVFLASPATGHELKVLASKMVAPKVGQKTTIYFSWGHVLPVDELVDAKTVDRYELLAPSGKGQPLPLEGVSLQARVVVLEEEGSYQAIAVRKSGTFTYVLDADGNKVLKRGPKSGITEGKVVASFVSSQSAKAILVSGKGGPVKANGLALEIIPQGAPHEWKAGSDLKLLVLFQGKSLAGATVEATYIGHRPQDKYAVIEKTGGDSVCTIRPGQAGTWVVRVRHQEMVPASKEIDYHAFTSTLALEIP